MSDKKKSEDKKPKASALGWGLARKAAEAITKRKKKTDLAIKEAGG